MSVGMDMPPEGHLAAVNGMRMYYEVYGEGTPLVLLHGYTKSGQAWHPFIADFTKEYRIITPDLRGHRRSTPMLEGRSMPIGDLVVGIGTLNIRPMPSVISAPEEV